MSKIWILLGSQLLQYVVHLHRCMPSVGIHLCPSYPHVPHAAPLQPSKIPSVVNKIMLQQFSRPDSYHLLQDLASTPLNCKAAMHIPLTATSHRLWMKRSVISHASLKGYQ